MKRMDPYPITVTQVKDHPETVDKVFLSKKRHSFGEYLGVCLLQGCSFGGNPEETASAVAFGDELVLEPDVNPSMPISVLTENGVRVGFLTYTDSVLPLMLIKRGIDVKCYAEAVELSAGVLSIAVSMYISKY